MDWIAIDFETATRSAASACALGALHVHDGTVVDSRYWLIRPPGNRYDYFNIKVHGITPDDTDDSPSFADLLPEINDFLGDRVLVAHNARFDMGVMAASIDHYDRETFSARYTCTLALGRKQWQGLPKYRLPDLCNFLGIEFSNHHNALADAQACADVALRLMSDCGTPSLQKAADQLGVPLCSFGPVAQRDATAA